MIAPIIGTVSFLLYFINTIFWVIPILILSLLKFLLPLSFWQTWMSYLLDGCATMWVTCNNLNQDIMGSTDWKVTGLSGLSQKEWYLVIANHQSWVDILVLQRIFNRKIPFLKFFLKKELIWVPVLGLAWWALDFPFMRRYSKAFIEKHPHLKGKDLETTRKACEKFQFKPVSVMNFVEGTRYTLPKHQQQNSRFTHLLEPRAGGIAFVLNAMGSRLDTLIDVTIHYPDKTPTFWDFVSGNVKHIQVNISVTSTKELLALDYFENMEQRTKFQEWLTHKWQEKDNVLEDLQNMAK
jgi:1-acyl-sn-glycerol-3-phosphate acyltransferase